ncbi:MAG: hypothetical protein RI894_1754 [Bacteroidota bacterium]
MPFVCNTILSSKKKGILKNFFPKEYTKNTLIVITTKTTIRLRKNILFMIKKEDMTIML